MQQDNQAKNKYNFIIFLVLLSFIPFGIFVKNAEGNFRKPQIKNLAAKRRERLDAEHGIDRAEMALAYEKLD